MAKSRRRSSGKRKYRRKKGSGLRLLVVLLLVALIGIGVFLYGDTASAYLKYLVSGQDLPSDYEPAALATYFSVGDQYGVPWYLLAAVDKVEGIPANQVDLSRVDNLARILATAPENATDTQMLKAYLSDAGFIRETTKAALNLSRIDAVLKGKVFPLPPEATYDYSDSWGELRTYNGEREHEGIDIFADIGTPIRSVCAGRVEKMGWLELGGWRIGIRGTDGMYYYYAHLSEYALDLAVGDPVDKGELIGYVGDSGYGPEGTTGEFEPHLHFGIYEPVNKAFSPYPFLVQWDGHVID